MTKSKTIRTLVAAGCVAGSAGCVSGPQSRPLPPPEECPPGAEAAQARFNVYFRNIFGVSLIPIKERPRYIPMRDGQKVRAEIIGWYEQLPTGTAFDGHVYLRQGRIYGRFTAAHLPDGETIPVCLELMTIGENARGMSIEPGSTATRTLVGSSVSVEVVDRFN